MKKIFILFSFILISCLANAQYRDSFFFEDGEKRLFVGGGLSAYYGSVSMFEISPFVGYKISKPISIGIGGTYEYYEDNLYKFSTNMYGGRIFSKVIVYRDFFAYGELEMLNMDDFSKLSLYNKRERTNVFSTFVGGGYRQKLGQNACSNIMILWNINETTNSPYNNPVIRINFEFGI